jgi:hypothetical protein
MRYGNFGALAGFWFGLRFRAEPQLRPRRNLSQSLHAFYSVEWNSPMSAVNTSGQFGHQEYVICRRPTDIWWANQRLSYRSQSVAQSDGLETEPW